MATVREGLRWHLIERERGQYDWSAVDAMVAAAAAEQVTVIWDLMHFGFPDWINPYHADFPAIFTEFARQFALRTGRGGRYVPVNEISFFSWAAGEVGYMHPWSTGRGLELKLALCAAALAATAAIREVDPAATVYAVEPTIAVKPYEPGSLELAQQLDAAQFEAVDILLGRLHPELGGASGMVDVIGVNHYPHSQWYSDPARTRIDWVGPDWTPLAALLEQVHRRYERPLLLSETGAEAELRPVWLNYVSHECRIARAAGVPIEGICLYPILSHIGWTGERYCPNGLFNGCTAERLVDVPYLAAVEAHLRGAHSATL